MIFFTKENSNDWKIGPVRMGELFDRRSVFCV